MRSPETLVLQPDNDTETREGIDRLFSDMNVGALMLKDCIESDQIGGFIAGEDHEFAKREEFKYLLALLANEVTGHDSWYESFDTQSFDHEHGWHLAIMRTTPRIRLWLHLRDYAEFSLARAKHHQVDTGLGFSYEEVVRDSYAMPVTVLPSPGDVLIFVDQGCREVTGTSTFHQVRVDRNQEARQRLSMSCDVEFLSGGIVPLNLLR